MAITKRLSKGSPLTHQELDDNFNDLDNRTPNYKPYQRITRFTVPVNVSNPLDVPSTSVYAMQDTEEIYNDWCVLILPDSYTPTGDSTKLVIAAHGGGGTVTSSGSQTEGYTVYKYLLSKGYAVMDCAGMPIEYAQNKAVDQNRVMGSFFAVNSYEKAYRKIIKEYNIDKGGVYLTGISNGGMTSFNIYAHSNIPIRCMAGMSPLLSMDNAWALTSPAVGSYGTFSSYQNRANIIRIYGMTPVNTQEELDAAVIEPDKVKGFDPYNYNLVEGLNGDLHKIHNTPYKIWHPIDDTKVDIQKSRDIVNRIKKAGGYAILREMNEGGHSPDTAGPSIGTFTYNGSTLNLHVAVQELYYWFNRF
jgi:predicted esterase